MIDRSQLLTFRQAAQTQMEELLPATVTIDGEEYECAGGTITSQDAEFDAGGQVIPRTIKFRILKSLLSNTPPPIDRYLTFNGERYRIAAVVDGTTDPAYVLTCEQIVKR